MLNHAVGCGIRELTVTNRSYTVDNVRAVCYYIRTTKIECLRGRVKVPTGGDSPRARYY